MAQQELSALFTGPEEQLEGNASMLGRQGLDKGSTAQQELSAPCTGPEEQLGGNLGMVGRQGRVSKEIKSMDDGTSFFCL